MPGFILEIAVVLVLILLNGLFAMSEIAIVSSRKTRLNELAQSGNAGSRTALQLANNPNHFFATIQIGITLVGVLAGAFGGATIGQKLAAVLAEVEWLAPYSQALGFGIVVVGISYLSLVIGELVPKHVALTNPEGVSSSISIPMRVLSILFYPAVRFLGGSTNAVLWLLRVKEPPQAPVTEDEIRIMMHEGTIAGVFEEEERRIVNRVFRLDDLTVGALVTPRSHIEWVDLNDSDAEIRSMLAASSHSILPVARESLDNVLGVVETKNLLSRCLMGKPLNLESSMQDALFVPETLKALRLPQRFKESQTSVAMVTDEYGGIEGLVTLKDVLEAIVGEIPAEGDPAAPSATKRRDGSWLMDGLLSTERFKEILSITDPLPGEDEEGYHTLAGFVMSQMGKLPSKGEYFEWEGWQFEIVDMDGMRIDELLVTPIKDL